jgi:hypothetical protein
VSPLDLVSRPEMAVLLWPSAVQGLYSPSKLRLSKWALEDRWAMEERIMTRELKSGEDGTSRTGLADYIRGSGRGGGAELDFEAVRWPSFGGCHDSCVADEEIQDLAPGKALLGASLHACQSVEIQLQEENVG